MRSITGSIFGLAVLATAGPAFAFPQIDTIRSETLSTSPLRVRTTFTVQLVGYLPDAPYWGLSVEPGQGPAVTFYDCQAPASWNCGFLFPGSDFLNFNPPQGGEWPWPGVTMFSIVTDQAAPCVNLDFYNGILGKTPQTNNDYVVPACLVVDAPTSAAAASWGSVKAIYR